VPQSVNPLPITFEASHRLHAKVNGLPAPYNLYAPKLYLKRHMKHKSFFCMLPSTTIEQKCQNQHWSKKQVMKN